MSSKGLGWIPGRVSGFGREFTENFFYLFVVYSVIRFIRERAFNIFDSFSVIRGIDRKKCTAFSVKSTAGRALWSR